MGCPESHAGFVLVGGKSSRMGEDKARLPFRGHALVTHIATAVSDAAGSVTLVGPPERYGDLGYPMIPDNLAGAGPLSGIQAALSASQASWNLIVACDMPGITGEFLTSLLQAADMLSDVDCILPAGPSGTPEPLCAAYHIRCLPAIDLALRHNVRKVTDALAEVRVENWRVPRSDCFQNVNTPQEWSRYIHA